MEAMMVVESEVVVPGDELALTVATILYVEVRVVRLYGRFIVDGYRRG
jgi:hypothetical protein